MEKAANASPSAANKTSATAADNAAAKGASPSRVGASFRRDQRIRRRAEFQQVYERGVRLRGRFSTMFVLPNDRPISRLGIAATKKLGGAVRRNRAKRLIREIFRRNSLASGFDVVIVPHREFLNASQTALEADYRTTFERRIRRP